MYINMANRTMSSIPPVQPPYWLATPTDGGEYAKNPVWRYSQKAWRRFDQAVGVADAYQPGADEVSLKPRRLLVDALTLNTTPLM
jgi:hypothetical protein